MLDLLPNEINQNTTQESTYYNTYNIVRQDTLAEFS